MNIFIVLPYILQHLFSIFLFTKYKKYFLVLSVLFFILVSLFKNDTYDLNSYYMVIEKNYPHVFEFSFYHLILFFKNFTSDSRMVLYLVQGILLLSFISLIPFLMKKDFKNYFFYSLIIISSVAFNLAIYNNLRQSFSSIFIIMALFFYYEKRYLVFIVFITLAQSFHESSIFFILYLLVIIILKQFYLLKKEVSIKIKRKFKIDSLFIISIVFAIFSVFILFFLLHFTAYADYNNRFIEDRILPIYKILPIMFLFIGSELLIGKYKSKNKNFTLIRILRMHIFFIFFIISFFMTFAEISPRILYMYFFIEMILMMYLFKFTMYKPFIFICINYAFAINVIKILSN